MSKKMPDAGQIREQVAETMARWVAGGTVRSSIAQMFDRRCNRLARMMGVSVAAIKVQAREDAVMLLDLEGV